MTIRDLLRCLIPMSVRQARNQWRDRILDNERHSELVGRRNFLRSASKAIAFNGITGDYAEFGCCGGGTFGMAYRPSGLVILPPSFGHSILSPGFRRSRSRRTSTLFGLPVGWRFHCPTSMQYAAAKVCDWTATIRSSRDITATRWLTTDSNARIVRGILRSPTSIAIYIVPRWMFCASYGHASSME